MVTNRTTARTWQPGWEIVLSRLLAAVAAAALVAAATALVTQADPVRAAHPRNWIVAVVACLLGLRIVAHARRNAVGWLVLVIGVCAALAVGAQGFALEPWLAWVATWMWWPSYSLLSVVMLVFPSGRLLSAWWSPVLAIGILGVLLPVVGIGWASWSAPATFWDDAVQGTAKRGLAVYLAMAGLVCFILSLLGAFASLVRRWFRTARPQRRLLVWAAACTALMMPALIFEMFGTVWGAWSVFVVAFPIAALVAIVRYGLYDIDLLIHRTLLYGLLSSALAVAYILVAMIAPSRFPGQAHLIGTVAVVLALAPAHRILRERLDRWLYGDRADPYRVLTQLGERLAHAARPGEVFPTMARTIAEALKLPYVAIYLGATAQHRLQAQYGLSHGWPQLRSPMTHGGNHVGDLVAEARAAEERFGRRERRLLRDLARQTAPAAQSAQLTLALQRAGEQFEREREEAMLRIARDLHDGIKPGLHGIRLQVDAVRKSGCHDTVVRERLDRVVDDVTSISVDVGRLVCNVRPADLDRGLPHAVRELAKRFCAAFTVEVEVDEAVEELPDTFELAAYRIVSEAVTNAARHAKAGSCWINLKRASGLEIRVVDDGDGIPPNMVPGIGLASMRKRCENLGGTFTVKSSSDGTEVVAWLPLTAR